MKHFDDSLSLKIPHEMKDRLKEIAESERRSVNNIARNFMQIGLEQYESGTYAKHWQSV